MNADGFADLDCHQVFTKLNETGVVLSHQSQGGSRRHIVVGKYCELGLHPLEHLSGFGSIGMVVGDGLRLSASHAGSWHQFVRRTHQRGVELGPANFVDQQVYALRKLDQIVGGLGVSRHDDGMTVIVDPEAERRFYRPMIDKERGDLYTVGLVNEAFANVGRLEPNAFGGKLFVHIAPHVDIERECFLQVRQHGLGALRSPDLQWLIAAVRPGCQVEFWQSDDVIGMEMSQEYLRHIDRIDRQRGHSRRQATATVEQEFLRPCQDQGTDAKSLRTEGRPASRPQQNYRQIGIVPGCGRRLRKGYDVQRNQEKNAQ